MSLAFFIHLLKEAHYSFQHAPNANVLVRPGNILCDGENRRLWFANFGNAVDIDPPRLELDSATLELDTPGSIVTNTLRSKSSP